VRPVKVNPGSPTRLAIPKFRDLNSISPADQDVGRLHVAMENAAIVRVTERVISRIKRSVNSGEAS
jgi:hypothetical protein